MSSTQHVHTGETQYLPAPRRLSATVGAALPLATLALVFLLSGATRSEASSITCGFGDNDSNGCAGNSQRRIFDFTQFGEESQYLLILDFQGGTIGGFDVTFEDIPTNQYELQGGGTSGEGNRLPPGVRCVPIAGLDAEDGCVVFHMPGAPEDHPQQGEQFDGDYRIDVAWLAATDDEYPGLGGLIRLLHDSSLTTPNVFSDDITIPGSYFAGPPLDPCGEEGELCDDEDDPCIEVPVCYEDLIAAFGSSSDDPGIGGRDINFGDFLVVHAPEPATLILVASGLGGALYRRRRQRQQN